MDPEFGAGVEIRDDVSGLMVSRGRLLIGRRMRVPASRVEALIQHEVGTHVLTHRNGSRQPIRQLSFGLPGYEALQEGLAVLAEYLVGALSRPRLRLLAARVVAVDAMIRGSTFPETFALLHDRWRMAEQAAFGVAMRVHRGGGMPKDAAYLRGLRQLVNHLGEGGEIEPLLIGKFGFEHIPIVRDLHRRGALNATLAPPRFLDLPGARDRLARLRPGVPLVELTKEKRS